MLKDSRYTIGNRIENKFIDLLELAYITYFSKRDNSKAGKISSCILTLDGLKFLITVAWEAKLISNRQVEEIILKLDEAGRDLGAWKKSLDSPQKKNPTIL